ncbi:MAG: hypothetical protein JHC26_12085 [Thermofilum sp.]|uniref:hypothetical protein n=1 Tax=Thermofilum sp. TaxID=1961369 RepID=UPI00258EFBB5|nr:hypothetical protein [Thermofilum sp.]MCI4409824.1 hypothetical protein [Thermofilum sp.]
MSEANNSQSGLNSNNNTSTPNNETKKAKKRLNFKRPPQKGQTGLKNTIYMSVEEDEDPIHVKVKRLIPKIIDEYVMTHKKPIRRKKLKNLVFSYDEKLAKFYEEQKEVAIAVFNFAVSKLLNDGKIIRVKDPDKKRFTYFILPKHLDMFRGEIKGNIEQGKSNGGQ